MAARRRRPRPGGGRPGGSRWPAVIAAVAASALQMALPGWLSLGPQMQQPELAPPGWKPSFTDYLYLSFTSAISFAASDVTPLTPLGEDHDDAAIGRLGRGHRARGRQGGEHPPLTS